MKDLEIRKFPFEQETPDLIGSPENKEEINWTNNWPVVYIISNGEEAYIGETYKVKERLKQHQENQDRKKLNEVFILIDPQSNKSFTLDLESFLIRYMSCDGIFKLQNSNKGLVNYEYFGRDKSKWKFEHLIWPKLKELKLAKRDLFLIQNDDLFKYSPYTPLASNQHDILLKTLNELVNSFNRKVSILINGGPGTGKTVLGSYLIKLLLSKEESFEDEETKMSLSKIQNKIKKIGFVIPQQSLRKTLKRVFKKISGLSPEMVLSPNDVVKDKFDLLIVDEAHRLRRRKNLSTYQQFDKNNKKLNLPKEATELDWILSNSKTQIFFYDYGQTIKPTDIEHEYFLKKINTDLFFEHELKSQFRVKGGENYMDYIKDLLNSKLSGKKYFEEYDFRFFDSFSLMRKEILKRNDEFKLARLVAGYGWKWVSKNNKNIPDIKIEDERLNWNTEILDWISSECSINEVGCIHTIQGYDLNFAGVIFGPEITYDFVEKKIKVIKNNYHDFNGKRSCSDKELEEYVKNIYGVLLTRGIRGTYVYAVDENLRKYLREFIKFHTTPEEIKIVEESLK
jgi:uncharacterized protein